jgi:hypothetical protein
MIPKRMIFLVPFPDGAGRLIFQQLLDCADQTKSWGFGQRGLPEEMHEASDSLKVEKPFYALDRIVLCAPFFRLLEDSRKPVA